MKDDRALDSGWADFELLNRKLLTRSSIKFGISLAFLVSITKTAQDITEQQVATTNFVVAVNKQTEKNEKRKNAAVVNVSEPQIDFNQIIILSMSISIEFPLN